MLQGIYNIRYNNIMYGGKGKIIKFYISTLVVAVFCIIFSSTSKVQAFDKNIVINEIYPAPLENEKEWVELYNSTDEPVNLKNYTLKDGAVSAKTLNGIIAPFDFYIFESNSGWLNNTSEILFLIDASTNTLVDKVAYGDWETKVIEQNDDINPDDNALNPGNAQSISRIPNGYDSNDDLNDFRITVVTKNAENILNKYSDDIKINEIFPHPAEGVEKEFIELYNTSENDIDLSNWQIDDIDGGSSPYIIPKNFIIKSHDYAVFYNKDTKISLNDSGDNARLIDPNNEIKDSVVYNKSERNKSYSLFDNGWLWSLASTPNGRNIYEEELLKLDEESEIKTTTIKTAKENGLEEIVKIEGIVLVEPDVLSSQYFYIQDDTAGIQIYYSKGIFPDLKRGCKITVIGEVADIYGEKRIKIYSASDIIVMEMDNVINPLEKTITSLSEDDVGEYVKTTGEVLQTSGDTFLINDNKTIKVIIKEGTNINKPKMRKGDKVQIKGILSSYKGEYRILPICQDGVTILTSGMLPVTGDESDNREVNKIISKNLNDTNKAAAYIVDHIHGGDILLLDGDLGSGKTTLTKSIAKILGVEEEITSPTYVIMKNYTFPMNRGISEIAHVDAYRLNGIADAESIGLAEYFKKDDILVIIEWPNNIKNLLPTGYKKVSLKYINDNCREIIINF